MLASFLLTVMIIELTPGPNMAYLAALTLGEGRKAGLSATAGVAFGLTLVGFASAAGLAAIIAASPPLWNALRWCGIAYLLWLAWESWAKTSETSPSDANHNGSNSRWFARGLITNLLNPKAMLFYVAILPGYLPTDDTALTTALALTLISVAVATLMHLVVVLLAAHVHPFLASEERNRAVRRILAIGLVLIALWFGFSTMRP